MTDENTNATPKLLCSFELWDDGKNIRTRIDVKDEVDARYMLIALGNILDSIADKLDVHPTQLAYDALHVHDLYQMQHAARLELAKKLADGDDEDDGEDGEDGAEED